MNSSKRWGWQDFSSIVNELRRTEKWGRRMSRHPVFRVWESAVGESIAKVAQPAGVNGSCLRVEVADSAWMQELQLMTGDILGKVNAALENGSFDEIQFWLGNSWQVKTKDSGAGDRVPQVFRQPVGLSAEDETAARELLCDFRDEELRDRVEHLLERVHLRSSASEEEERNVMNLEERG
jgi:hypothetical protein